MFGRNRRPLPVHSDAQTVIHRTDEYLLVHNRLTMDYAGKCLICRSTLRDDNPNALHAKIILHCETCNRKERRQVMEQRTIDTLYNLTGTARINLLTVIADHDGECDIGTRHCKGCSIQSSIIDLDSVMDILYPLTTFGINVEKGNN